MTKYIEMVVPDLGATTEAKAIEWLVQVGDKVRLEQPVLVLESEKTTLEVPATVEGVVRRLKIKLGDRVSTGMPILEVHADPMEQERTEKERVPFHDAEVKVEPLSADTVYAGPTVRRLAREHAIDLKQVTPTGKNQRIMQEDIEQLIEAKSIPAEEVPQMDFDAFGEIQSYPLSRIKKLSSEALQRNWLSVPHVTQFDEADITELDAFRQYHQARLKAEVSHEKTGIKLTVLPFVMKALVHALQVFPQFNASLSSDGQQLILKQYYHMGIAVDTENGLVVPVLRDVSQSGLIQLATELAQMSQKARAGQLKPAEMQGHSFSISSLGHLGGRYFTPIINVPDVAILGISKASIRPVYREGHFKPRLLLPLSLSYDHRVIDGSEAMRFMSKIIDGLRDIREWLL
jgi:pyruvate dehydrogenase E2 component (dihydrolipoamide acetyltransferase)